MPAPEFKIVVVDANVLPPVHWSVAPAFLVISVVPLKVLVIILLTLGATAVKFPPIVVNGPSVR